jgi:hypothetical protein
MGSPIDTSVLAEAPALPIDRHVAAGFSDAGRQRALRSRLHREAV